MTTIAREALQSVRSLFRHPGLAITIVLTLAVGIGSTSAVFSVADAMFLRPLALASPDRLIVIEESRAGKATNGNAARLADWRTLVPGIEAAAGFYSEKLVLTGRGDAERITALRSFGPIFAVLGIEPQLGRRLTTAEEGGQAEPVVLLSDGYWRRRFGGDPGLLGQTLDLDGAPHTIVGILPRQLDYPERVDILMPAPAQLQRGSRKAAFLPTIARMKAGVALPEIDAQLASVADRLGRLYPATDRDLTARAVPLLTSETAEARVPVLALLGAIALVLLTACTNVAGLLLARGSERQKEAAIRVSLGASRWRMVRLYLIESLALAFAGCVAGLGFAAFGLSGLKAILPADLPRIGTSVLDWRVTLFAVTISLLCASAFGIALAVQSSRVASASSQKPRDAAAFLGRRILVAGQVALSLILLIGAGLLGESFLQIKKTPLGFSPAKILTVNISFPWDAPDKRVEAFRARALEEFSSIPGVISVGWGDRLPLNGGTQSGPIALRNRDLSPALREESTYHRAASESYFQAIGIPVRSGRIFAAGKSEAVVNETLAKKFFPQGDAIGNYLTFNTKPKPNQQPAWLEIVGIVGDVRQNPNDVAPPAEVYVSGRNLSWPLSSFVLRVQGDPNTVIPAVRETVRRIDPNQVVDSVAAMNQRLDEAFREPRLESFLVLGFALTALAMTMLGIYGVVSSEVIQRTREIGVRMALGADPRKLVQMMLRRSLATVVPGVTIGLAGAAALTRFVVSLLYGVKPLDGTVFLGAALLMAGTALLASYFPARRAASVSPIEALRSE
jgi:predicted permease